MSLLPWWTSRWRLGVARLRGETIRAMPDTGMGQVQDGDVWEGGGRRYRMEKVVGNGAFGIVWRAREEGANESVAIKKVVLDRRYHNRELEMMKGLDHECKRQRDLRRGNCGQWWRWRQFHNTHGSKLRESLLDV